MDPSTKTTPYQRPDQPPAVRSGSGLELSTLVIAACASAAAAFVTSRIWTGGALFTAALTPVIVAVVKEVLQRPVERVKTVRLVRTGRVGADDALGDERPIPDSAAAEGEALTPVTVYTSSESRWDPRKVRIAVATGLLAFLIVVAVFTLPELVAGASIGGGNQRTTLFGGTPASEHGASKAKEHATPTATPRPGTTPTATPQATATPTSTPAAQGAPTSTPTTEAPAPQTTAAPTTTP